MLIEFYQKAFKIYTDSVHEALPKILIDVIKARYSFIRDEGWQIGFWKAEDYQMFTFSTSKMPEKHYHVWVVIVRIVKLVFSCGRNGWTQDTLELLKNLVWRHTPYA